MSPNSNWLCVRTCPGLDWNGEPMTQAWCSTFGVTLGYVKNEAIYRCGACVDTPDMYDLAFIEASGSTRTNSPCANCKDRVNYKDSPSPTTMFCSRYNQVMQTFRGEPLQLTDCILGKDPYSRTEEMRKRIIKSIGNMQFGDYALSDYCPWNCAALSKQEGIKDNNSWCGYYQAPLRPTIVPVRCLPCRTSKSPPPVLQAALKSLEQKEARSKPIQEAPPIPLGSSLGKKRKKKGPPAIVPAIIIDLSEEVDDDE